MSWSRSMPVSIAFALEQVDEVLGGDVAGRVRGERAAAEAADRRVEDARARFQRGERIRVAGVARVVEVAAERSSELGGVSDQRSHCSWGRDADRVGEEERVGLDLGDPGGDLQHAGGIHLALERAPEGDAERHGGADPVSTCSSDDPARGGERVLDRSTLVPLVERLCDTECKADLVEPGREQPVVAALVQRQPGADGSVQRADRGRDLLCACHLRHAPRVDEARHLDAGQAGRRKSSDQLDSDLDVEDFRLVLEPVAWAHVVDRDTRRFHQPGHITQVTQCHKLRFSDRG